MNGVRTGPVCNPTNANFANLLGQFRNKQGQLLSDVHFPSGNGPQGQKVLINGNMPQSIQLHPCHTGSLMHRYLSSLHLLSKDILSDLGLPQNR